MDGQEGVGEMSRGGTGVHLAKGSSEFLSPELLLAKAACEVVLRQPSPGLGAPLLSLTSEPPGPLAPVRGPLFGDCWTVCRSLSSWGVR